VVKLIEVYPDSVPDRPQLGGHGLMVNADIMSSSIAFRGAIG